MSYRPRYRNNNYNSLALDEYRNELVAWMVALKPRRFITLTFNRDISWEGAVRTFKAFNARMDRYALGTGWSGKAEGRTDLVAFAENLESNFHFHALGDVPSLTHMGDEALEGIVASRWKAVMPSGTANVQSIHDVRGVAKYVTKQLHQHRQLDRYVASREYWTADR